MPDVTQPSGRPTEGAPPATAQLPQREVAMAGSPGLTDWLAALDISLAFTTYQTNRLFLLGRGEQGGLAVNERLFDRPMGLFVEGDRLHMAGRTQILQLENRLAPGETHTGQDRLYVPAVAHTTGDLNAHDVVVDRHGRTLFVNTDFSCLAALRPGYSFEPLWQPPFISKLAAEDRCHLNGLALQDGEAAFATACSSTDQPAGWRHHRRDGGVVLHIPSSEIVATGLSMPHSPRWHDGKLWLLNSGTGELGCIDGARFQPVAYCPGFVRGLAFVGGFAVVGLSRLRSTSLSGLALDERLAADQQTSECGLRVVDLRTGEVLHGLHIDGVVEELYDVVVLPGVRRPGALGFQDDTIDRVVSFPGSGGLVVTKPGVRTPTSAALHKPGLLRPEQTTRGLPADVAPAADGPSATHIAQAPQAPSGPVKYQQVFHLTPENLRPYEAMTSPSLQQRWAAQPRRGELLAVSASVGGTMVGFAVAELFQGADGQPEAELISLRVLPPHDPGDMPARLVMHLQKLVGRPLGHSIGHSLGRPLIV
jgi:uncharacterized protein (TIGR03032 family)